MRSFEIWNLTPKFQNIFQISNSKNQIPNLNVFFTNLKTSIIFDETPHAKVEFLPETPVLEGQKTVQRFGPRRLERLGALRLAFENEHDEGAEKASQNKQKVPKGVWEHF